MSNANMMFAFDHVPALTNSTGGNLAVYASDFPFTFSLNPNNTGTAGTASDTNGMWLQNAAQGYVAGQFSNGFTDLGSIRSLVSRIWDSTKARSYVGFRFKVTQATSNPSALTGILGYLQGSTFTPLVAWADFSWVLGQVYYIEVMIDRTVNTRTVWVDGAQVVNATTIATTSYAGTDSLAWGIPNSYVVGGGANYPYQFWYKDIYVKDDVIGTGATGRLGPLIAKPISAATATGSSWVPSTGTIASALNTAINTSTPSTPNVAMATDGTPLSLTLQSTVDPSALVQGVLLLSAGSKAAGTSTTLRATLQDQATPTPNQQALSPMVFPSVSFGYGKSLGFLPNALDGGAWTAAKIAALTATLTATST